MKKLFTLAACALTAAGFVTSSFGQIQTAGTLQVSLDAVGLPAGPVSYLNNAGAAGGVFQSVTNAGLGPQVIALGGSGTHGVMFDGEDFLVHQDGSGNPMYAPDNLTSTSFTGFSVEAWVFAPTLIDDNPIVSWGTRNLGCGSQVSCAYGANGTWGGLAMWCYDHGWGPGGTPTAGSWHYLAWTLDSSGNENLYADGVLKATYTGAVPNIDPNNNIAIGFSHASTGGTLDGITAGVIVGRVRIDDGILTDAQVLNNFNFERASFTNGTPAFLAAKPRHRWSFTNAATNDAVGLTVSDTGTNGTVANAVVQGVYGGGTAQFTGSQLLLNGGSSASAPYVDLPNGLLSSLSTNKGGPGKVTFETWVAPQGAQSWARVFDFGSNTLGEVTSPTNLSFTGVAYATLVATPGGDLNNSAVGFLDGSYWFKSRPTGSLTHMALTWDDNTGLITVYENGIEVTTLTTTNRMNDIVDVNDWLGRSNWSGDGNLQGGLAEFRIFSRILSPAELLNDYQVGPAVVDKVLKWNGNVNGVWDNNTTANWLNGVTSVKYNDGGTVQFDDSLTGTANVNLTFAAQPSVLTFNNSLTNYTLTGAGKISGAVSLAKSGTASLTLGGPGLNDYTGQTLLNAGTLIVTNLANGTLPSAIGAASSASANLAFAGGTLSYRGPATSINRGYLVTGNSTLDVQGDLAISGPISATGGTFTKAGAAKLTINSAGNNKLSAGGAAQAFGAANGTVVIDGTAGQTNTVTGETWVGFNQASGASMILNNTVLTNSSWVAIGRGNGTGGYSSSLALSNSTLVCANLSMGFANGIAGNNQKTFLNLSGNSRLINGASVNWGESTGSSVNIGLSDNSWIYSAGRILISQANGTTSTVTVANSATITNLGWVSIGAPGVATVTLKDNAIWQALVDFNVTDTAGTATYPSIGTLNIQDNALLRINTLWVGKSAYCTGTINQSGGTVLRNGGGDWRIGGNVSAAVNQLGIWNFSGGTITCAANFQVGAYGTGYFNQSGGTANFPGGYPDIGRFAGAVGYLNVSGGSFNQLGTGNILLVGEAGTGTLNVSGTGTVNCFGSTTGLGLGWTATGIGTLNLTNGSVNVTNNIVLGNAAGGQATVNLYGGTLAAKQVYMGNASASSYINFYGGTLKAMPNANANFLSGLTAAYVYNGAVIDSDTNVITIAQDLNDGGVGGGITKLGSGALTLSGYLYYTGPTLVSLGSLGITTHSYASGNITVADGATLSLQVVDGLGASTSPANLTLGNSTGATLNFNLGNFAGIPTTAPFKLGSGSGTLTVKGNDIINIDVNSSLSVGQYPLIQYGARAGAGTLTLGTLPPGVFANLVTNTATTPNSIDLLITSVVLPRWQGLAGGTWDVQTTTNWVDELTSLPDFFYQGSRAVFNDLALGTTNVNLVTTVAPGGVLVSNSALIYTISGAGKITGGNGLTKVGAGLLTLSTTNNNYTGPTLLDEGGTLASTLPNNLGTNNALIIGTGTLSLGTNSQKFASVTVTNGIIAASGAVVTAANINLENAAVSAVLAGGTLSTFGAEPTNIVNVLGGNTYTGRTVLGGSVLVATSLANGGAASSIGASSASPTNLVFNGGTLSYQGPAVAINRGYSVAGGGTFDLANKVTLSGSVAASGGLFTKSGLGLLDYVGTGSNVLSAGSYHIGAGTVMLDGSLGAQTNFLTGELWVGYSTTNAAALTLTNTSLGISSWLAIDRGNGTLGLSSLVNAYNSTVSCGNLSMGFDGGIAGNSSFPVLNLFGNSTLRDAGVLYVGESAGGDAGVYLANNSAMTVLGVTSIGRNTSTSTGAVVVANSAVMTVSNTVSVGMSGSGTLTVKSNATWLSTGDMNVGELTGSEGILNIQDNAQVTIGTLYVGKALPSVGTVNQTGGTLIRQGGGDWRIAGGTNGDLTTIGTFNLYGGSVYGGPVNLQIGAYGQGEWNQTGGFAVFGAYPSIGRYAGAVGQMDVSGGSFNMTNPATLLIVGEEGTGTLNISAAGLVTSAGGVSIGHTATGVGVLNLNGGTLVASRIIQASASGNGTFNFNGGLLQARPGSYPGFMNGLTAAYVLAGGAKIDSGANSITVGQALQDGGGGLTKLGSGTLVLAGASTYTGLTTVSNGTLEINGSVAADVTVESGAVLEGIGTVGGVVTVLPGGILAAGNSVGTFTLNSSPVLQGEVYAEVNRNGGTPLSDLLVVAGNPLAYGGTLVIANTGAPLVAGDRFTLFNATGYSGAFTGVSTATPGQVVTWDISRLTVDGSVKVASAVATAPTTITTGVSGGNLNLSWPADHTGWRLLEQTNHLSQGLSTNMLDWDTVAGSSAVHEISIPINTAKRSEFYRLVYP